MKKALFVGVFILLVSAVFAQRTVLRTSDGVYYVSILSEGQNRGQEAFNRNIAASREMAISVTSGVNLTEGQWEAVNYMLNRYQTTRGNTFFISIGEDERIRTQIVVIVEFTSNTEYNYWTYRSVHRY